MDKDQVYKLLIDSLNNMIQQRKLIIELAQALYREEKITYTQKEEIIKLALVKI